MLPLLFVALAADPDPSALAAVAKEGATNEAAAAAWKAVVAKGPDGLFVALKAFKGASPAGQNWLRAATDAVAEGEAAAKRPLPADKLKAFALDTTEEPAARRIAYELLFATDKPAAEALLPGFLNDASGELRRDAVADALAKLEAAGKPTVPQLQTLFKSARDKDQVVALAKKLEDLGAKPDVVAHYGFITRFHLAGPFDSTDNKGFEALLPPQKGPVDLNEEYDGKDGAKLKWVAAETADPFGVANLNKLIGKHKFSVAFAYAEVAVNADTDAEIRAGTKNAVQLFVNGQKVYEKDEYHHGMKMDQHLAKVKLKAGTNAVLVKACQNDQKESWAQEWDFQVRLCDATGGAIPMQLVSPAAGGGKK